MCKKLEENEHRKKNWKLKEKEHISTKNPFSPFKSLEGKMEIKYSFCPKFETTDRIYIAHLLIMSSKLEYAISQRVFFILRNAKK